MTEKYDKYQEEMDDNPNAYGTQDSVLLKMVREQGFKPIGITIMMCEETFIFKSTKEAKEAWEMFKSEGWWYDFGGWEETRKQYVKDIYEGDEDLAPTVYWLDKNFEPKK